MTIQTAFSVIKQFMMDESGEQAAIAYANNLLARLKAAGVKVIDPDITCFRCKRTMCADLFKTDDALGIPTCTCCGYGGIDEQGDRQQEWFDQFGFTL